jgi:hypothetical protein
MSDIEPLHLESHRHWEHEASFNEILAEQLSKAPYLIASIFIHAVIFFVVGGIMLLTEDASETPVIEMQAAPPPPEIEEEEEPPPEETIEEVIEEPVLMESELEETVEQESLEETGDPDFTSDAAFDSDAWNNAVGIGGGAGGKYGGRGGRGGGRKGGNPTEAAVLDALKWLRDHQNADGLWDCDEFMYEDKYPDQPPSDGAGDSTNDVGVTGLALLAFLGNGHTMSKGQFSDQVRNGIGWLRSVQDMTSGLYGEEVGNPTLYNHSIASMAMGEAYFFGKSPLLKRNLRKGATLILNSQNPYNAWRYSLEPDGANDSSITGWMVFALKTAEDGKIAVPKSSYEGAKEWFKTMTDMGTGRTGYAFGNGGGPGGPPSRVKAYLEKFPPEKSEALTAVALLCQIFMTDVSKIKSFKDHEDYDLLKKQADLLISKSPLWDEEGGSCDMYYWYYGTFAMNQWGGKHWKSWKKSIEKALLPNQRQDKGNFKGSWDPVGPWGEEGGRVYSTAICALILEVYYRYARVLGAR